MIVIDGDIVGMTCCHLGRIGDGHFCYHELNFQIAKAHSDRQRSHKITLVINNDSNVGKSDEK